TGGDLELVRPEVAHVGELEDGGVPPVESEHPVPVLHAPSVDLLHQHAELRGLVQVRPEHVEELAVLDVVSERVASEANRGWLERVQLIHEPARPLLRVATCDWLDRQQPDPHANSTRAPHSPSSQTSTQHGALYPLPSSASRMSFAIISQEREPNS